MTGRGTGGLAALTFAAAFAAGGSAQAANAPKAAGGGNADAARVAEGKALYANHCSHCHGVGLVNSGNVVPDLREFDGDEARFVDTVTHGKNGRMPPWGDMLSRAEIEQLWAYIRTKRQP
jgi:mono/diheme cytochrome c family protein